MQFPYAPLNFRLLWKPNINRLFKKIAQKFELICYYRYQPSPEYWVVFQTVSTSNCFLIYDWTPFLWMSTDVFSMGKYMELTGTVCRGTCVGVNAECRHSGVFVHEAICNPSVGALISVHCVYLQDKRSRRLIFQDWCALSVLQTLRGEDYSVNYYYAEL